MLQQRSLIVIGLAVLLGLAAVYLANVWLGGIEQKQTQTASPDMVKVAVATAPMDYGTEIKPEMVRMVDFPANAVPQGAFGSLEQLLPMNNRRVALRPIEINEPILASRVSGEGGRASLSAVLKPDMRALSVNVSATSGVAGFVLPGEVVDVLVTRSPESGGQITDVLLQNVRVLAMDQNASEKSEQPVVTRTATLEVSQVDAQKLALAERVGSLSLALRKPADPKQAPTNMVTTVSTEDLRDGAYGGSFRSAGPMFVPSAPTMAAGPGWRPAVRVARPRKKSNQVTVQVVRATSSSSYEVRRHAGF